MEIYTAGCPQASTGFPPAKVFHGPTDFVLMHLRREGCLLTRLVWSINWWPCVAFCHALSFNQSLKKIKPMPMYSEFLMDILPIVTGTFLGLTTKKNQILRSWNTNQWCFRLACFCTTLKKFWNVWIPQSLLKKMKSSSPRPQCGEIN